MAKGSHPSPHPHHPHHPHHLPPPRPRPHQDAEGVTLRFADGGEARAAVLVGCDGIWSHVRRQRLGAADPPPRYMGVVVVLGRAPCAHPLAQEQVLQTVRVRVRARARARVPRVTLT